MLDFRIETFLMLCSTMNYTKAAEKLNLTQPAVTQQIHYLEELFGCKLFHYSGKTLSKTEKGTLLEQYAKSMRHNQKNIMERMKAPNDVVSCLRIGATKTIGEFVIGNKIKRYLSDESKNISLTVDNTKNLLQLLEDGCLDFTIIEGYFEKSRYSCSLFQEEPFLGICAQNHPFANQKVRMQDLFAENILVREKGSGTRDIFEQMLHEHSFSISDFKKIIEINNFAVIKKLVNANIGISFVYHSVIENDPSIACFTTKDTPMLREFNYVFLKNTLLTDEIQQFLSI